MCTIVGLSNDPHKAYQQGRRDGQAEILNAVELSKDPTQYCKDCFFRTSCSIKLHNPNVIGCTLTFERS